MPRILVEIDVGDGSPATMVDLEGDQFSVGRDKTMRIVIKSELVSRRHLLLAFVDGCWMAQDLHSANGVYVNEKRIETSELRLDDVIRLGEKGPTCKVLAVEPARDDDELERTRFFRQG